jgi:hypothetical protein
MVALHMIIHPQCLSHKFKNIYKPKDSTKQLDKELFDEISCQGEGGDGFGENSFSSLILR